MTAPSRIPLVHGAVVFLLVVGVLLTGVHVAVNFVYSIRAATPEPLRLIVDFRQDNSLMGWLSILTNIALGIACIANVAVRGERRWWFAGALFLFLSLDDTALLHERFGGLFNAVLGQPEVYSWVLVFGPICGALGLLAFFGMWRAARADQVSSRTLLAGFAALAAALGIEALEGKLIDGAWRWRGFTLDHYTAVAEEFLELLGPVLLLAFVLRMAEAGRARRCGGQ